MGDRNRLFISYSHKDTEWLQAVKEPLAVLEAEGLVSLCDDTQLAVGEPWAEQLNETMLSARLGLLLISNSFLTSNFVRQNEVPRLFEQHEGRGMKIYPLLVRPCPWKNVAWLARLQLRPQDSQRQTKALSTFPDAVREELLADIANEIAVLMRQ